MKTLEQAMNFEKLWEHNQGALFFKSENSSLEWKKNIAEYFFRHGAKFRDAQIAELTKKEKILEVAREWKHFWMNQRQNSEEDYQNYFNRAFGIDANMIHDLADRITKSFEEASK
jgi:hypothetical protein